MKISTRIIYETNKFLSPLLFLNNAAYEQVFAKPTIVKLNILKATYSLYQYYICNFAVSKQENASILCKRMTKSHAVYEH